MLKAQNFLTRSLFFCVSQVCCVVCVCCRKEKRDEEREEKRVLRRDLSFGSGRTRTKVAAASVLLLLKCVFVFEA